MRRNGSILITTLGAIAVAAALVAGGAAATARSGGPGERTGVLAADTPWGDGIAASPSPSPADH